MALDFIDKINYNKNNLNNNNFVCFIPSYILISSNEDFSRFLILKESFQKGTIYSIRDRRPNTLFRYRHKKEKNKRRENFILIKFG